MGKGCHRLGTRDWYLMHYSNPFITGGQKHTHTLGGDPSPSPSHPPHPMAPCPCLAALFELAGHIPHDIAHVLGNQLILLVLWGCKFDIQISYQYGDMPLWALSPCSLDVREHCQIGWWDIASHSIVTLTSQYQHKGDKVWSARPPFLDLIEFVWLSEESDSPLLDTDCVGREDVIAT
jgi:hypothetical protein